MNIVICGAGEVGRHVAEVLGEKANNITIVDLDPAKLTELDDVMDVRSMLGNGTQADVLLEAGCAKADLFIAATQVDEVNLLAASVAKALGAGTTVARVHHSAFFERRGLDYGRHLGVDHLVCPEYSTAEAIAAALRSPGARAFDRFAGSQVEMQAIRVAEDAAAVGQPLSGLKLAAPGRVAAIERHGTVAIPDANTVIEPGDIVTLIGEAATFPKIAQSFDSGAGGKKKVIIMGGSTQAVWLCRALKGRGFSVRLFIADEARALELSPKLEWVTVLNADAINSDALEEERVDLCDAFVAVTDDDERNILAAARAKTMGATNVMAVLQRGTYLHLLSHIGIDRAFSPRVSAVNEIQFVLGKGAFRHLSTIAEGSVEVFQAKVTTTAKALIGQPLKMVKLPQGTLIGAVSRGDDEVFVPTGDSVLEPEDTVIVIGGMKQRKELRKLLTGK